MNKDYNESMEERRSHYNHALDIYHKYRYEKVFKTLYPLKNIPEEELDVYESKYRKLIYNELDYGKHFLFQVVEDDKMSKPILGTFVEFTIADQAVDYRFILPTRTWEKNYIKNTRFDNDIKLYSRDMQIESIIEWHEYIYVFGIWDKFPNWKEIKTAMKDTFYYRLSRKDKISRILK